jgi:hypothetical protein
MSVSSYDVASAVEYGLSIPPLIVLSIVSLIAVRRRNDPLRLPFLWLKLAIPLLTMYMKSHVRQYCPGTKLTLHSVTQFCHP